MKKIAMLSTGCGVIPRLHQIAKDLDPEVQITHFLDDGIIEEMAANGNTLSPDCLMRLMHLAQAAELTGASALLVTCSSISEFADHARPFLRIPVCKIDEPMLRLAVSRGSRIGVMATLPTTLEPTLRQLKRLAAECGKSPQVETRLAKSAYQAFVEGRLEEHDALACREIEALCGLCDVVVLAQVSIASAAEMLPASCRDKVLSSPRSGIEAAFSHL